MLKNLRSERPRPAKQFFRFWPLAILLLALVICLIIFLSLIVIPKKVHGVGILLLQGELSQILSPVSGTLESWEVEEGDSIAPGNLIATVRDHKEEDLIKKVIAKISGVIAEIIAYPNVLIHKGQTIAVVTSIGDPRSELLLTGFVSSLEGKKLKPGMKAIIKPTVTNTHEHGSLLATVKRVGRLPMTKEAIQSIVKIPEIAKYIRSKIDAEPFVVVLSLISDKNHVTGYKWNGPGPDFVLDSGIFADIEIIYEKPRLLFLLWPQLRRFF